jgi:RND family efflux transporter MFP subunit
MDNPTEVLNQGRTGKRHYVAAVLLLLLIGALLWVGYRPWRKREDALLAAAKEDSGRAAAVTAVRATRTTGTQPLELPGTISAIAETSIYARAEGYVKARYVDIGDHLRTGQLMAEIDTPELDEQLRQAKAQLAQTIATAGQSRASLVQAQANLRLADIENQRTQKLVKEGVFAVQQADTTQAAYDARMADVDAARAAVHAAEESTHAAQAEVARLTELMRLKRVTAPFAGVITSRTCDVGTLVNASSLSAAREMYRLADISTVRILINVPEPNAPSIAAGQPSQISPQAFPGRTFAGRVARTANALDAANRTLLTEIHVPNPDGKLLPGMYAQVKLLAAQGGAVVLIPGDTITVRSDGTYVVTVDASSTAHFRKVGIGRDYGSRIEVSSGLSGSEVLVVNPGDSIREGVKVVVVSQGKD